MGKESFDLTLTYLKNRINLKNTSYTLFVCLLFYGFQVWIYEAFPHFGNYAVNSLDSSLPIPHFVRWHTLRSDNIIEDDPLSTKEEVRR
ncbi:hypothetical protein H5410_027262 [Solanum commersonii]|uniref:Uncharacterized protein n=1 Tax=Solanum commersonii TaxID=4109 RepID=A0A9J5YZE4_SOLCO|nr:hypothetical protein H5410_027262 [Solanum commersonii]